MILVKEIEIKNPPTKYIKKVKKRRKGSKKKGLSDTYYLTGNLFYSNIHFTLRSEIVANVKGFLIEYMKDIPKQKKIRIDITYQRPTDNFDLDNKVYFWQKVLLDLIKEPTKNDIKRAEKNKTSVKMLGIVKDDSCKYVSELNSKYEKGVHLLRIKIYDVYKEEGLFSF